jgi:hypothetical protein
VDRSITRAREVTITQRSWVVVEVDLIEVQDGERERLTVERVV